MSMICIYSFYKYMGNQFRTNFKQPILDDDKTRGVLFYQNILDDLSLSSKRWWSNKIQCFQPDLDLKASVDVQHLWSSTMYIFGTIRLSMKVKVRYKVNFTLSCKVRGCNGFRPLYDFISGYNLTQTYFWFTTKIWFLVTLHLVTLVHYVL